MVLIGGIQTLTGPIVARAAFTWLQEAVAGRSIYWQAAARASRSVAGVRASQWASSASCASASIRGRTLADTKVSSDRGGTMSLLRVLAYRCRSAA